MNLTTLHEETVILPFFYEEQSSFAFLVFTFHFLLLFYVLHLKHTAFY